MAPRAHAKREAAVAPFELEGALSDDGVALIVQYRWSSVQYRVDPKTGALLGSRTAAWSGQSLKILDGTHLAPVVSTDEEPRKKYHLVAYDAVTGATVIDTPAVSPVAAASSNDVIAWLSPEEAKVRAHVWDAHVQREIDAFEAPDGFGFVHMPSSAIVVVGNNAGVTARDVKAKRTLATLEGDPVRRPPLSPNGKYLALATRAGKVMLVELATGKTTTATCGTPGSLAFDKTGGTLAVGSTDRVCLMKVPSLETIRTTAVMRGPDDPKNQIIRDLHFFADDRALIGNTEDTVGLVYDVTSGGLLWKRSGCQPVLEPDRTTFLCRDPANEGPNRYVGVKFERDLRIEEESSWDQENLDVIGKRLWEARLSAPLREALARIAPEVCAVNERLLVPKAECSLNGPGH